MAIIFPETVEDKKKKRKRLSNTNTQTHTLLQNITISKEKIIFCLSKLSIWIGRCAEEPFHIATDGGGNAYDNLSIFRLSAQLQIR